MFVYAYFVIFSLDNGCLLGDIIHYNEEITFQFEVEYDNSDNSNEIKV